MRRKVDIFDGSGIVSFDRSRLRKFIKLLDEQMPEEFRLPAGDLSIAIFNDDDLVELHRKFLDNPAPTDVITFDGDPDDGFAGEICVSASRALECAKIYGNTPSAELCLYIAHGTLHLAGINDIEAEDAAVMRRGEREAINILEKNFKKPIFKFNA